MEHIDCGRCKHEWLQHKDSWHCLVDGCLCMLYSELEHCQCWHPSVTHNRQGCHAVTGRNMRCDCVERTRRGK